MEILTPPATGHEPRSLPAGKLPAALLARLLGGLPTSDPALLVGPTVGEDAAVIDFAPEAGKLLVAKTDPITFATDEIGYYAVNVCANDIAVAGALPRYYMPTLLMPAGRADPALAERIFAQIGSACRALGIVVAGGHSEVTPAVLQPVVAGAMLGEVTRDRFVHSGGCRPGDVILLAGTVPVEGVSLIARERRATLLARGWDEAALDQAAAWLHVPGISVLVPAHAASQSGFVSAMHDPTEGGVATGLAEIASAAQVGLAIDLDAIPVAPAARALCAEFGLDPLGTIASGALLAACAPAHAQALLALWQDHGWHGTEIGRAVPAEEGLTATRSGRPVDFPVFAVDELTKLWSI